MQETQEDILTDIVLQINNVKRKQLLPWWIKLFMWIFLLAGVSVPFGIIFGIFGYRFSMALYGLATNEFLSVVGITIASIFLLKGIVSYGLLMEKDWAIKLGILDASLGILICMLVMVYSLLKFRGGYISFRIELLLLIPYLIRLFKIKPAWEKAVQIE